MKTKSSRSFFQTVKPTLSVIVVFILTLADAPQMGLALSSKSVQPSVNEIRMDARRELAA